MARVLGARWKCLYIAGIVICEFTQLPVMFDHSKEPSDVPESRTIKIAFLIVFDVFFFLIFFLRES